MARLERAHPAAGTLARLAEGQGEVLGGALGQLWLPEEAGGFHDLLEIIDWADGQAARRRHTVAKRRRVS